MFTRPEDLTEAQVVDALAGAWDIRVSGIEYLPVGFGSHHWQVVADGRRWFVTADDLEGRRRYRGEPVREPLRRLDAALSTASTLRDAGLGFVVAPIATVAGAVLHLVDERFAVALYPHVDGTSFAWGPYPTRAERVAVLERITALHAATGSARATAMPDDFMIPARGQLIAALNELDEPWDAGPFGEPARELLGRHARAVQQLAEHYDHLAARVASQRERTVVTHGEPHRGNTMLTADGVALIDWDTVLIAPPERDLWALIEEDPTITQEYERRTGVALSDDALALYRLGWDLTEIALYVGEFRDAHRETDDTRQAWAGLRTYLDPSRWPTVL